MADPKSNVQEVIERLTDLKGFLDDEIKNYVEAKKHVDANHRVADNTKLMEDAKAEIVAQVARIDTLILDNPDIGSLIGAPGDGEIETLNKTIAEVLAKVEEIKALGIEGVSLDTDTGKVVSEVKKLEGMDAYQDAGTRKADAADKKTGLESRIENAKRLKAIYDAHPGMDKDAVIQSVYDAQEDFSKIDMKTSTFKKPEEYKEILENIYSVSRAGKGRDGKYPYETTKGLQELEKQIKDLEALKGDPEIDAILSTLKGAIKVGPDGKKTFDISKLSDIKAKTVNAKAIKVEEKINAAKAAIVTANKTSLESLITSHAVFDYYPEKKQQWLDLLKEENPDVDAIQAEIEATVLTGVNAGKFEEFVRDSDEDVSKLPDLEKEYREADAVEKKLTTLGKKHVTDQTEAILGYNLQAKNSKGEPVDIAKLNITDAAIIDGLYMDFEEKAEESVVEEAYQKDPLVPVRDKKPGLLRRAFWKLTHPDSWGTGKGLADELRETWVKGKIVASVEHLQADAKRADGAVWTLSPEKLEEIQKADMERSAAAKEDARKAVIAGRGSKTAEDAEKQARADAAKKQAEADRDLDI